MNQEDTGSRWSFQEVRRFLGHFGLLFTVTVYTAVGAIIFRILEQPAEEERLNTLAAELQDERSNLLSWHACRDQAAECGILLERYSDALYKACKGGVPLPTDDGITFSSKWTFPQAAFFATTVLTTIGYGNLVPETFSGRLFCILFALIGIPLTVTVIADMGVLLATAVSLVHEKTAATFKILPVLTLSARKWLAVLAGITFLIIYLAAGAGMFMFLEEGWGFFEGFYFCFITMTTIGFGDLVPGGNKYMALCTIYILVGLSLTSTIIELVRRQYAQSWKTLQALTGPLAESLKRLGECGTSFDVSLHGDLRKLLTMMSMPGKTSSPEEWQAAVDKVLKQIEDEKQKKKLQPPKMIQIIVYESSV